MTSVAYPGCILYDLPVAAKPCGVKKRDLQVIAGYKPVSLPATNPWEEVEPALPGRAWCTLEKSAGSEASATLEKSVGWRRNFPFIRRSRPKNIAGHHVRGARVGQRQARAVAAPSVTARHQNLAHRGLKKNCLYSDVSSGSLRNAGHKTTFFQGALSHPG